MGESIVSIIIPTLREAKSLPLVTERIVQAMRSCRAALDSFEIVIVDDNSRDGTIEVCAELARRMPLRLITRTETSDGLGGAVLMGLREAKGDVLVVMDADLQHPPERLPALIDVIEGGGEFALGSRHVAGASTDEKWGMFRRLNSAVATLLARPFAGPVRDPMSGFFALPRRVFERGEYLAPLGYKIGLELICKCRVDRVTEVPIHFGVRAAGESKLTLKQQFKYLEHLSRLYDFCFPRLAPALKFLIVVACAWLVGAALLGSMRRIEMDWILATLVAYVGAIATAGVFHLRYVRTQRAYLIRPTAWRDFLASGVIELGVCMAVAWYIDQRVSAPTVWERFLIPFMAATVVRYMLRKELLLDIRGLRFIPRHVRGRSN